jgi:hypothetical protein
LSVPIFSASGTASPVIFSAEASKGWATSVRSRTKRRYPGGAYWTSVWAGASGFLSAESIDAIQ